MEKFLVLLRNIILTAGLEETVKWGSPIYTFNTKNIVGIGFFKNFVSVWFMNGVFLKDKQKKLINAQEGVTKALRQWRFTEISEINQNVELLKEYLYEAIEIEKLGKSIKPKRRKNVSLPSLLINSINKSRKLKNAFENFTPAKQREFSVYISQAKRDQTKLIRLNKIIPLILKGEGLNDKYK